MKKYYFVLTSVLALTACGWGGGGGHSGSGVAAPRAAITPDSDVAASNAVITSMASEILVASDGTPIAPSMVRSASAQYNGKTYTSYRLDDVSFKIGGEDSLVKFELDPDGKIIALGKYDRSDDFTTNNPEYALSEEGRFVRSGETNQFTKKLYNYKFDFAPVDIAIADEHFDDIEFMDDSSNLSAAQIKAKLIAKLTKKMNKVIASQNRDNEEAYQAGVQSLRTALTKYIKQINDTSSFGAPDEGIATLTVEGVNNATGLRYADLGFAELVVTDNTGTHEIIHNFSPYVGGYDAVKVNASDLETDTTYTGTAIAGIDYKAEGSIEADKGVLVRQDDATLTMNRDGSSSLVMNDLRVTLASDAEAGLVGKKWYNMTVNRDNNGLPTFIVRGENQVTGYDLPSGETPVDGISFTQEQWFAPDQEYVFNVTDNNGTPEDNSDDIGIRYGGSSETGIYGLNAGDTEATSRFSFSNEEHWDNNVEHREIGIYGAFGGKPTPAE